MLIVSLVSLPIDSPPFSINWVNKKACNKYSPPLSLQRIWMLVLKESSAQAWKDLNALNTLSLDFRRYHKEMISPQGKFPPLGLLHSCREGNSVPALHAGESCLAETPMGDYSTFSLWISENKRKPPFYASTKSLLAFFFKKKSVLNRRISATQPSNFGIYFTACNPQYIYLNLLYEAKFWWMRACPLQFSVEYEKRTYDLL